MLICGSQRASESALVDFVTAEGVGIPRISTPGKKGRGGGEKNTEKLSKLRNALRETQIQFSKPVQKLGMTE